MKLESADLIRYNANTRGSSVGDCTARAISLAFNIDYRKARKALNDSAKENWRKGWNYNNVNNVIKVIRELGGGILTKQLGKTTVGDWADLHNNGTYIIHCNRNGEENGPGGHLVTIIDGKIYDSWDSRTYYVLSYHAISTGVTGKDITDVGSYLTEWIHSKDLEGWCTYANTVFGDIINKNRKLKKLSNQYHVDFSITLSTREINLRNYNFLYKFVVGVSIDPWNILKRFRHEFAVTFKPTMDRNGIETYFDGVFYDKLYTYLQTIVAKIEDICDGYSLIKDTIKGEKEETYLFDDITKRSFNNLPYWVQRLTTYFNVKNPFEGCYYDSVELIIRTPSFDTQYSRDTLHSHRSDTRYFHAYRVEDLKRGLAEYRKTGNYDEAYEIAGDY